MRYLIMAAFLCCLMLLYQASPFPFPGDASGKRMPPTTMVERDDGRGSVLVVAVFHGCCDCVGATSVAEEKGADHGGGPWLVAGDGCPIARPVPKPFAGVSRQFDTMGGVSGASPLYIG